ncbi:hypothetical protein [Pseudogemmobacter faecipullorum]|uniref:Uncharacterized protein n=1 Tax=Pseudogemmobacter faecipullorum TaxID=2755041 RepID=A0ABS8CQZ1_9RHOB|nr:hypothetical protein [Pseudogemmobacter faecipullorum]MCB5411820.1 hypothetical protein [Pseudogemmobacter faecipullorum]
MKELLVKIDLSAKSDSEVSGAFKLDHIHAEGVTTMQLIQYLVRELSPIASNMGGFLNEGCGFGVIMSGNEVTVIGIKEAA